MSTESPNQNSSDIYQAIYGACDELKSIISGITPEANIFDGDDKKEKLIDLLQIYIEKANKGELTMCFYGATGAGKSTIINKLIGRDNLLPTSGFVTTEVPMFVSKTEDTNETAIIRYIGQEYFPSVCKAYVEYLHREGYLKSKDITADNFSETVINDENIQKDGNNNDGNKNYGIVAALRFAKYIKAYRDSERKEVHTINTKDEIKKVHVIVAKDYPIINQVNFKIRPEEGNILSKKITILDLPGLGGSRYFLHDHFTKEFLIKAHAFVHVAHPGSIDVHKMPETLKELSRCFGRNAADIIQDIFFPVINRFSESDVDPPDKLLMEYINERMDIQLNPGNIHKIGTANGTNQETIIEEHKNFAESLFRAAEGSIPLGSSKVLSSQVEGFIENLLENELKYNPEDDKHDEYKAKREEGISSYNRYNNDSSKIQEFATLFERDLSKEYETFKSIKIQVKDDTTEKDDTTPPPKKNR